MNTEGIGGRYAELAYMYMYMYNIIGRTLYM